MPTNVLIKGTKTNKKSEFKLSRLEGTPRDLRKKNKNSRKTFQLDV